MTNEEWAALTEAHTEWLRQRCVATGTHPDVVEPFKWRPVFEAGWEAAKRYYGGKRDGSQGK